jgi:hypothetical protein
MKEQKGKIMKVRFRRLMAMLMAVTFLCIFSFPSNAATKFVNVRYINPGSSVKLKHGKQTVTVRLLKRSVKKVNYDKGLTQLVTVRYKYTVPEGWYPVSYYETEEDFTAPIGEEAYWAMSSKILKANGKKPNLYWPAANEGVWTTDSITYYRDSKGRKTSIKSFVDQCVFLKRPSEQYIVGVLTSDKYYKNLKSMPYRYRSKNLSSWFTKKQNRTKYTVFTKIY